MKKILILFIYYFNTSVLQAQSVGIGTATPNANSQLDVSSTNKGLLVPRVDLVALTANSLNSFGISATPITSLLVYNTTASTLPSTVFQTGFYYWDATGNWTKLNTGATSSATTGWGLAGNSGTTASNFIGTTDDNDIFFKRNNAHSGRINSSAALTAFGLGALNIATTGAANTAIGAYNLQANTSGYGNTAIGTYGLATNSQGFNNSALGYNALINNSIGNENTSIGKDALFSNTTGNSNTSIGANAQNNNTIGYSNVAIGKSALYKNTGSNNNVAIGDSASFFYLDGVVPHPIFGLGPNGKNTAIGSKALYANILGRENTAIGFESMKLSDGYLNTGVGSSALFNTTGQSNVGLGAGALYDNLGGQKNSAFGTYSLSTNTTGSYNTGIGFQTQTNGVGLVNATAIGAQARVDCSNCLVLGSKNAINGATSDVNVGIGTTEPQKKLHIVSGGEAMRIEGTNPWIGFAEPASDYNGYLYQTATNFILGTNSTSTKNLQLSPKGIPALTATQGGNIGIGTTTPQAFLEIKGASSPAFRPTLKLVETSSYGFSRLHFTNTSNVGNSEFYIKARNTNVLGDDRLTFQNTTSGEIMSLTGEGKVGIGTTTPTEKLTVITQPNSYGIVHSDGVIGMGTYVGGGGSVNGGYFGTTTSHPLFFYTAGGNAQATLLPNGNFGIGTSNPTRPLSFPSTNGKKISLYPGANGDIGMGVYPFEYRTFSDNVVTDMTFGVDNFSTGFTEVMRIKGNGNVGIGTNNPQEKLSVNGRIRSKEVQVQSINWPDFVFDEKYELPSLKDVEKFITTNKHLQNIPSAKEIEANGQNLGEVQKNLLQKIEELTLYVIELNKKIEKLEADKKIIIQK